MSVKIIEALNENMASILNKTGEEYLAIFGDIDAIPSEPIEESADYNTGAIANELEMVQGFIEYQILQNDTDTIESDYLDSVVEFFTTIKRIFDETDESLRNRFHSIVRRSGAKKWMPKWGVRDVFKHFFPSENLYVLENPVEDGDNLVLNSSFEDTTGVEFDDWTRTESGSSTVTIDTDNPFIEDNSVKIHVNPSDLANIQQTMSGLTTGFYKVEFFHKDDGAYSGPTKPACVSLQRSGDSYYWNPTTKQWQSGFSAFYSESSSTQFALNEFFFELTDTRDITIRAHGKEDTTVAYDISYDEIKIAPVKTYPSIKVLVVIEGTSTYSLGMWDNGTDPIGGYDYAYAGFLDNEFIEGPGGQYTQALYEEILAKSKVGGTKEIFEMASRTTTI